MVTLTQCLYTIFLFIFLSMGTETTRPTPIDKTVYVKFGNKCRTNNREINNVLTDLCNLYLKSGEKIF